MRLFKIWYIVRQERFDEMHERIKGLKDDLSSARRHNEALDEQIKAIGKKSDLVNLSILQNQNARLEGLCRKHLIEEVEIDEAKNVYRPGMPGDNPIKPNLVPVPLGQAAKPNALRPEPDVQKSEPLGSGGHAQSDR